MYPLAPIKRMSILERRPGDDRAFFARHWSDIHGAMIAHMPFLHAYVQNHVVEDFPCHNTGFAADGIVEQLWCTTAQMQRGYNSAMVPGMIADEANYLGHGSNYAILASGPLREAADSRKVIVALRHGGDVDLADKVADKAAEICGDMIRDDVIATIAKANFLPVPPRAVDMFLHLHLRDPAQAADAGRRLAEILGAWPLRTTAAFGVWRVRTKTIVKPG
jgi:hypothetical protein